MDCIQDTFLLDPDQAAEHCLGMQEGADVLAFSAVLTGEPGSVTVHARDTVGLQGASLLASDSLDLNLAAGPMTGLAFEESGRLRCGMRDCIGALKLLAVDCFGNTADCPLFEVASQVLSFIKLGHALAVVPCSFQLPRLAWHLL